MSNKLVYDSDICREIRNMYTRTNTLICKFNKCTTVVKYDCLEDIAFAYMVLVYGQDILRAVCQNSRFVIIDASKCSLGTTKCTVLLLFRLIYAYQVLIHLCIIDIHIVSSG